MSIAHVQAVNNQNTGSTSINVHGTQGWVASTAGNLIIVVVNLQTSASAVTVTDNLGSTYTDDYSFQTNKIHVFSLANCPGGITTVTASGFSFDAAKISVFEYSGAPATSPFDTSAAGKDNGFGVGSWSSNTTGTTNANGGIVLTIVYDWRISGTLSISTSGYTSEIAAANAGGTLAIWDKADAGSSTYSASGSGGTGSSQILAAILVYKAAGGSPPPSGNLFRPAALAGLGAGGPFFGNPLN